MSFLGISAGTWGDILTGVATVGTAMIPGLGPVAAPLVGAAVGGLVGGITTGLTTKSWKDGLMAGGLDALVGGAVGGVGGAFASKAAEGFATKYLTSAGVKYALPALAKDAISGGLGGAAEATVNSLFDKQTMPSTLPTKPVDVAS